MKLMPSDSYDAVNAYIGCLGAWTLLALLALHGRGNVLAQLASAAVQVFIG